MQPKTNIIQFEAATAVIEYNITEAGLAELRKKCTSLKASDKESYKLITQTLSEVRGLRTGVEKRRVEYKADALEYGRRIDAEAKRVTALLIEIENPLKTEKEAWDNEQLRIKLEKEKLEQERINSIIDRIEKIKNAPLKHQGKNKAELSEVIATFETTILNDTFEYSEFQEQATNAKIATLARLKEMQVIVQKQEIEATRLAAERKQLEEEKLAWEIKKAKEAFTADTFKFTDIGKIDPEDNMPIIQMNLLEQKKQEDLTETEKAAISFSGAINLAKAIAEVEIAKNPIISPEKYIDTNKPTYDELVQIIEKMIPMIAAISSEDYEFLTTIKSIIKNAKGE